VNIKLQLTRQRKMESLSQKEKRKKRGKVYCVNSKWYKR